MNSPKRGNAKTKGESGDDAASPGSEGGRSAKVEIAKDFVTLVGSSLAGITALFYAAGFIAESSRWSFLGHSPINMPQQEFVKTGGEFFLLVLPSALQGIIVFIRRQLVWGLMGIAMFAILAAGGNRSGFRWRNQALLAAEGYLLLILLYFMLFSPTCFVGLKSDSCHISLMERDLLFGSHAPPAQARLLDSYGLIMFEYVLSLLATVILHLIGTESRGSDVDPRPKEGTRSRRSSKSRLTSLHQWLTDRSPWMWKTLHRSMLLVASMFLVVMTLLLPVNFGAHVLIYDSFPVVELVSESNTVTDIDSTIFLLLEDEDRYLLLLRSVGQYDPGQRSMVRSGFMRLVRKESIHSIQIVENRVVWGN